MSLKARISCLGLCHHTSFSLLARISHFSCANAQISHFWLKFLTFPARLHKFLTFHSEFLTFCTQALWISHFSHAGMSNGDLPARASPSEHANNKVVTMSLGGPAWEGPAGGVIRLAGVGVGRLEKWEICWISENFAGKVAESEKFEPKVRNWRLRADKVRNSIFNVHLSEKFAR